MSMSRDYAEFATAKAAELLAIDSPTGSPQGRQSG